jgi:hypothetical protein
MSDLNDLDAAYEQAKPLEPDVPPGDYVARAVSVQYRTSTFKGAPGLCVRFVIEEGPHCGRFLWNNLWLKDGALPISKRILETIGFADLKPTEILAFQDFYHLPRVLVRVKHDVYDGRKQIVITSVRKWNQSGATGTEIEGRA